MWCLRGTEGFSVSEKERELPSSAIKHLVIVRQTRAMRAAGEGTTCALGVFRLEVCD